MEDLKLFFLNYIRQNGKILSPDMVKIKQTHGIGIDEQMRILKGLASESKISDKTKSWWEPVFLEIIPIDVQIASALHSETEPKTHSYKEQILSYIREFEGEFDETDLFIDYGMSSDIQKKYIDILIKENKIIPFKKGYRVL